MMELKAGLGGIGKGGELRELEIGVEPLGMERWSQRMVVRRSSCLSTFSSEVSEARESVDGRLLAGRHANTE